MKAAIGRKLELPRGFGRQKEHQRFTFTKGQIWFLDFLMMGWVAVVGTDMSRRAAATSARNIVGKSSALGEKLNQMAPKFSPQPRF